MSRYHPYYRRSHGATVLGGFLAVVVCILCLCCTAACIGFFASIGAESQLDPGKLPTTVPATAGK